MKTLKVLFAVFFFALLSLSCKNEGSSSSTENTVTENTITTETPTNIAVNAKAEFTIEGMTCAMGCAKKIENKLATTDGVTSAIVDFDKKLAMVEFDENKLSTESLEAIVKSAGESYSVSDMKTLESFTGNEAKHKCNEDCAKEGCTAEKKKACGSSCTKPCGAKKA
jgi:periplasmic mercuric ion binding protein